jgi:hypothetical protein
LVEAILGVSVLYEEVAPSLVIAQQNPSLCLDTKLNAVAKPHGYRESLSVTFQIEMTRPDQLSGFFVAQHIDVKYPLQQG